MLDWNKHLELGMLECSCSVTLQTDEKLKDLRRKDRRDDGTNCRKTTKEDDPENSTRCAGRVTDL